MPHFPKSLAELTAITALLAPTSNRTHHGDGFVIRTSGGARSTLVRRATPQSFAMKEDRRLRRRRRMKLRKLRGWR